MKTRIWMPSLITVLLLGGYAIAPTASAEPTVRIAQTKWKPFASSQGNFAVLMPGTPTEEVQSANPQDAIGDLHLFHVGQPGSEYAIVYNDFPEELIEQVDARSVLEGTPATFVEGTQGQLLGEEDVDLKGYPGKAFHFRLADGASGHSRVYLIGQRLYQLVAITPKREDAQKFLESFQLLKD